MKQRHDLRRDAHAYLIPAFRHYEKKNVVLPKERSLRVLPFFSNQMVIRGEKKIND